MEVLAGLCSVTFRQLAADAIVDLASEAGLEAVEWGADVHVPPGATTAAASLAERCAAAGIHCGSYGSYLGVAGDDDAEPVLDTALALGAPNVRVWCPMGLGPDASPERRAEVARSLEGIARAAHERALTVSLEFHPGTLTETAGSALALLCEVQAPNLFTYWQPDPALAPPQLHTELATVAEHVSHLHVFHWQADRTRLPLAGAGWWPDALDVAARTKGRWARPRVAFLEFVRDDDPEQLARDATTLRTWLSELGR
jgi:3-dehydroshikimate dehydratase